MERLTNHFDFCEQFECKMFKDLGIKYCIDTFKEFCHDKKVYDKLREYEDLEEEGLLLKLPCKIGTKVYQIRTAYRCEYDYIDCPNDFPDNYKCDRNLSCEHESKIFYAKKVNFEYEMLKEFGEKVFLTEEECKNKIKEMEKDNG